VIYGSFFSDLHHLIITKRFPTSRARLYLFRYFGGVREFNDRATLAESLAWGISSVFFPI
jgi:hypothetical protein